MSLSTNLIPWEYLKPGVYVGSIIAVVIIAIIVFYFILGNKFKNACTKLVWVVCLCVVGLACATISYVLLNKDLPTENTASTYYGNDEDEYDNMEVASPYATDDDFIDQEAPSHTEQVAQESEDSDDFYDQRDAVCLGWSVLALVSSMLLFVIFSILLNWKLLPRGNYAKSIPFNLSK